MRVVVDTNVYLSAILVGGICERVLDQLAREDHLVFISSHILGEVREVLKRKFRWNESQLDEAERDLKRRAILITPRKRVHVIPDNRGDNRILECAVAATAQVLITGDRKHLLPLGRFMGTAIVSPREFLQSQ